MTAYAELQVTTNFSFLRGASHPEELVETAATLGLAALAITDRNSLAGVVRAHVAAKPLGIKVIIGARLDLRDAPSLLVFPTDRAAYGQLCRLLSLGRRRATKGNCDLTLADVLAEVEGQIVVALPSPAVDSAFAGFLLTLNEHLNKRLYLSVSNSYSGDDNARLAHLADLAHHLAIPLVATNDVHAHDPSRRPLQDVLTSIRLGCTLAEVGYRLFANAERHLKPPEEMARLFTRYPEAIANTLEIARHCRFSLDELRYEYPVDPVPNGRTPQEELTHLAWVGAAERYPAGIPEKVHAQIAHELDLIAGLGFAPYFLTVHDIVRFARSRDILCQGRGSAANSAVCYCLGITAVDPARIDLLFERFVSAARGEPPDIDVDFEHERREEVIQYVYAKYGRDRAGMTATVTRYRHKSALREVAKVMGLSGDAAVALQSVFWRRHWDEVKPADIRAAGLDPTDPTLRQVVMLAGQLRGFPRHLSQHTGGMVITASPLCEVVPIENAAMADRTVLQWDKDDLDVLGILKIDLLGLGMLTCIRKAFALIAQHHRRTMTLATVPPEDPAVYDMLCRADSVGVFQVESRAQMSMLPRLCPRNFYDLVIEVAIVRPGPIQGDMVHPYLRRRQGLEVAEFPSQELADVLGKTLGVPLFQEQAMKIAIVAAGFSPAEADGLRRAMATFRRSGTIVHYREKFIAGMIGRGYTPEFAERCFRQIEGFADYGFPESHSASFALLVYISAWLKCHHPAGFACALLNSQPLGFYAPAQIVADARRHGVPVRPVDVNHSDWDSTLEATANTRDNADIDSGLALRLGFRQVKGLSQRDAEALVLARDHEYTSVADCARRADLGRSVIECLARADAFGSLQLDRRRAFWSAAGIEPQPLPLFAAADAAQANSLRNEPTISLPPTPLREAMTDDYRSLRLSLKAHPLSLLRPRLTHDRMVSTEALRRLSHGQHTRVAGLVITRQRPGSANGVIFITLEDETGTANLIIWPKVFDRFRQIVLRTMLMAVSGPVQRQGDVIHVLAQHLENLDPLLSHLAADRSSSHAGNNATFDVQSRDFH